MHGGSPQILMRAGSGIRDSIYETRSCASGVMNVGSIFDGDMLPLGTTSGTAWLKRRGGKVPEVSFLACP
jgi:hypothetical protein